MKPKITEELLSALLKQNLSTVQIGIQLGYTSAGIRYHMNKYGLESNHESIRDRKCYRTDTEKQCPRCTKIKSLNEFDKRPNGNICSYCKVCTNENRYAILKRHKLTLITELGKKCSICGYNKNSAALEFHHTAPEHKDFSISNTKTTNLDKIRKEMEKCILVCSNCHKEIHYPQHTLTEIPFKDVDDSSV